VVVLVQAGLGVAAAVLIPQVVKMVAQVVPVVMVAQGEVVEVSSLFMPIQLLLLQQERLNVKEMQGATAPMAVMELELPDREQVGVVLLAVAVAVDLADLYFYERTQ
jgi:hypothetical protein